MIDSFLLFFVFCVGAFVYLVSNKLKLPTSLFLIFLGLLLRNFSINGYSLYDIEPYYFLFNFSIFVLVVLLFIIVNEFSFHELDLYGEKGLKLFIINSTFNILFLTFVLNLLFDLSILKSLLLAIIFTSTDYTIYNHIIKKTRIYEFLKYESIIGNFFVILIMFLFLSFLKFEKDILIFNILPFFVENLLGFAIGLIIAIIVLDILKHFEFITEYFVFFGLILTFLVALFFKVNAVFSVLAFALLFERLTLKRKQETKRFFKFISLISISFVFIILGLLLPNYTTDYLIKTLFLFLVYLIIRFFALFIALFGVHESIRDILFMTLTSPKGIDVLLIALIFKFLIPDLFSLVILFSLFSIVTSTFAVYFLERKEDYE